MLPNTKQCGCQRRSQQSHFLLNLPPDTRLAPKKWLWIWNKLILALLLTLRSSLWGIVWLMTETFFLNIVPKYRFVSQEPKDKADQIIIAKAMEPGKTYLRQIYPCFAKIMVHLLLVGQYSCLSNSRDFPAMLASVSNLRSCRIN